MSDLIKLHSGDYVSKSCIKYILVNDSKIVGSCVQVGYVLNTFPYTDAKEHYRMCRFSTLKEAEQYRDELAEVVGIHK